MSRICINLQYSNVDKSVIKLSVDKAIATEGTYTVKVPAGYFVDKDGYSNKALTYTIVVDTPKNILNFESVNPVQGEIDKLVNPITLYYAESIKDFTAELIMKKDGVDQVPVTLKRNETNSKEVNISFDVPEGITEKGIYTIEVPEKTITDVALTSGFSSISAFNRMFRNLTGYTPSEFRLMFRT